MDMEVVLPCTALAFAEKRKRWWKAARKLFSAMVASLKCDGKQLAMALEEGDVKSLRRVLDKRYGTASKASRFQLIMQFILLSVDSSDDLESYIARFREH